MFQSGGVVVTDTAERSAFCASQKRQVSHLAEITRTINYGSNGVLLNAYMYVCTYVHVTPGMRKTFASFFLFPKHARGAE